MPKSHPTSEAPDTADVDSGVEADEQPVVEPSSEEAGVTPLDGDQFLQANRTNREKYRAEADEKAAKAARKAARSRRGAEGETQGRTQDTAGAVDEDRTPRKLVAGGGGGGARWTRWASKIGSRSWAVAVMVALVVVLVASTAVLAVLYVDAERRAEAASAGTADTTTILDTARRYASEISTYNSADYSDLDRRIREISTPAFTQTYIESSQDARRGSTEAEAVSTAKADNAGVMSSGDGKAVVLVTLDQTLKSPQTAQQFPEGFPYQSRVKVTLVQQDGRWLMEDFAVL
ncbi:hypothetical protein IA539_01935 [Gordonia sp. zg691]|uniref:hypothetical protein n=1 Tax=Gordonia jinghuaiqii TaxID=2758710 RepID=UPI0016624801|nr:hypothetical protein [Gordonia jinghuaiqii]MBD0859972.1 hypothetical protein [Gordonia jinghuaiqii]